MEITNFSMGDIIRSVRRSRGCTQDALAQAAGVSVQAVSKWETGASLPDIALLPAIADFLGISIDALFNRTSVTAVQESVPQNESALFSDGLDNTLRFSGSITADQSADGSALASIFSSVADCMNTLLPSQSSRADWTEQIQHHKTSIEQLKKNLREQGEQLRRQMKQQSQRIEEQSAKLTQSVSSRTSGIPDLSGYNDGSLNILQVMNGRVLSAQEASAQPIRLALDDGCDLTVHIHGNAEISGDIDGDVYAEHNVHCGDVDGDINAGGVTCGNVEGDVNAGGVTCENVSGDVNAGSVTCENVSGDVRAEGSVMCSGSIEGDVTAGGSVTCGDIGGDVRTDSDISCRCVEGDVTAYGSFRCEGDIEGDVYHR